MSCVGNVASPDLVIRCDIHSGKPGGCPERCCHVSPGGIRSGCLVNVLLSCHACPLPAQFWPSCMTESNRCVIEGSESPMNLDSSSSVVLDDTQCAPSIWLQKALFRRANIS